MIAQDLIFYSYLADLLMGDPRWFPHPVKLIGRLISVLEHKLRLLIKKGNEGFTGVILVVLVVGISGLCAQATLNAAVYLGVFWGEFAWVFIAYTTLSVRDLCKHGYEVLYCLETSDIKKARKKLSLIVGRDTNNLSKEQIVRAATESIAENTTDGIIAPLFYLFLGGPVLAVAYKAANTLDSMVGHKNERYFYFGRAAAKLDDVMNFIPARITGVLIVIAALLSGNDHVNAWRIMRRDSRKHSSPNSAVAEAAMAGALGVQLGGACFYSAKYHERPVIGDAKEQLQAQIIQDALIISFLVSLLAITIGIILVYVWQNLNMAEIFTA
ncbi:MAG: adenosylcobinamide-phosphate synthase CbiB [Candidatus Omnitrophica bacterium]|nr:adenosylcobinamide-phosphate synthase CbiB [Candidatus Omnitrophota bacterium]